MSFTQTRRLLPDRFRCVLLSFLQKDDLPFSQILSEREIEGAFDKEDAWFAQEEDEVFSPPLTLWAFLSQVLHKGEQRSCLAAVSRIIVLLVALGREPCAKNNGGYCKARAKLPTVVIERLAVRVAQGCEQSVPESWLWKNRHVKLADGTTVSMPDTEANQDEYPQQASQQEGLGFPVARLVVLMSLATAMVTGMAIGPYSGKETGEMALMRQLLDQLEDGDILLADRYFCSYFMIALLMQRGVDFTARLHHARKEGAYRARRLGKDDCLIEWPRPAKPSWMDQDVYDQIPDTLTLRQVNAKVSEPGFRVKPLVIITSLVDCNDYSRDEIAQQYRQRWLVELDIRAIKCTLGMDVLRGRSPEMVRKEVWTCLLAYNLIRKTILQSAKGNNISPREVSFAAAVQSVAASWVTIPTLDASAAERLIAVQIESLIATVVGQRPNRIEPRAVKRRPKPIRLLNMTREQARELLLAGTDPYKKRK